MFQLEEAERQLAEVRKEIAVRFPKVFFYEGQACDHCKAARLIIPLIDPSSGTPKTEYIMCLIYEGDGKSTFLDGGALPLPNEGIKEHDHGLKVACLSVWPYLANPNPSLRTRVILLAEALSA